MDPETQSFFNDALLDREPDEVPNELGIEVARAPAADSLEQDPESRDTHTTHTTNTLDVTAEAVASEADTGPRQTSEQPQDQSAPPRAMFIFTIGEHRLSYTHELGVLNEYPEALETITSNQCLITSAFLAPALHTAMAELGPSMMVQVAVRLTAVSFRLVAEILPIHQPPPYEGPGKDEQLKLAESIRHELDRALPYFDWQGARNHYGRIRYLMVLLKEAIRVLAVPIEALAEALRLDIPATHIAQHVIHAIVDLGQTPANVCGAWAAETLLSAWLGDGREICEMSRCLTPDSSKEEAKNLEASQNSDSEEDLPSPSTFVRRKVGPKASRIEVRIPRAADDTVIGPGNQAGKPPSLLKDLTANADTFGRRPVVHFRLRAR